jgi:hypothetical protein
LPVGGEGVGYGWTNGDAGASFHCYQIVELNDCKIYNENNVEVDKDGRARKRERSKVQEYLEEQR